jgi:hypothetical protein
MDVRHASTDVTALKAGIYQAQGNLEEAARFLSQVNEQTAQEDTFQFKITQLRLERNFGEAVRLLRARQGQFHFASQDARCSDQVLLAFMQRLAGETAGAKLTAEQARNTLERLCRDQPDSWTLAGYLSKAYAVLGEKDPALREANRAIVLVQGAKDRIETPRLEENLVLVQTIFGENGHAISSLTQLLQTPYESWVYPGVTTPALLRLDPFWDPLRGDPSFQKLCEEKQP